jgi:hypothetical protein
VFISHRLDLEYTPEDEDVEDGSDEEPLNGLVEALFDEIERLRLQVRFHGIIRVPHPADLVPAL